MAMSRKLSRSGRTGSRAGKEIMPTSRAGVINKGQSGLSAQGEARCARFNETGITLIEMLVVVTLIAVIAGVSYPSIGSGIESLRLRSASTSIASFLNTALDRASRSQQPVEIRIVPKENSLTARSADMSFTRVLNLPDFIHIASIAPAEESAAPGEMRRFLIYPGGSIPRIGVEIVSRKGQKRLVSVDPFTGVPHSEPEK
ncbi:MAG: pilus assembly FimT family protein [Bryobacteraceae bacterium]